MTLDRPYYDHTARRRAVWSSMWQSCRSERVVELVAVNVAMVSGSVKYTALSRAVDN